MTTTSQEDKKQSFDPVEYINTLLDEAGIVNISLFFKEAGIKSCMDQKSCQNLDFCKSEKSCKPWKNKKDSWYNRKVKPTLEKWKKRLFSSRARK